MRDAFQDDMLSEEGVQEAVESTPLFSCQIYPSSSKKSPSSPEADNDFSTMFCRENIPPQII